MPSLSSISHHFNKLRKQIKELHDQTGIKQAYLLFDFLWAYFRHGCLIKQYFVGEFYRKKEFERRQMLTYRRVWKIINKYNDPESIHLLENKVEFNKYFKDFIHRKWVYSKEMTYSTFIDVTKSSKFIMVKPIDEWEGHGIKKINTADLSESEIKCLYDKLVQEDVLIEECIEQDIRMRFQNESVNTIRIYSFFNPKNSKYIMLKPLLRVGVGKAIIDNYCSGGCVYELDPIEGVIVSRSLSKVNPNVLRHPGTDICMLGYQIPYWSDVVRECEKAHRSIPQCQIIGWDVAITNSGKIEFIEGNHNPDYELLEFIGERGHYKKIEETLNNN